MSTAPYVNFYPSDWLAGVASLTPAEVGVYINTLALIYENNGPVAYDPRRLSRRMGIGAGPLKKIIEALIEEGKLALIDGKLSNKRAEIEIQKRVSNIEKNSKNARTRWEKTKQKQQAADASASDLQEQPEPEPEPDIIKEAKASLSSGDDESVQPLDEIAEAVSAYNVAAGVSGWPSVRLLSKSRRAALAQRLRECGGLEGWAVALAKAQSSSHCCGQNDRGWVANFDFLSRQSSFTKLMEGNYDNRTGTSQRVPNGRQNGPDPALEQIARLAGVGAATGNGRR